MFDLFLIHWPLPMFDQYVETWTFYRLLADGRVRSIGVSNFEIPHLRTAAAETGAAPAVNQVSCIPSSRRTTSRFDEEHGILTESWGPLGQGKGLLEDPTSSRSRNAGTVRRRKSCCAGTRNLAVSSSPSQ